MRASFSSSSPLVINMTTPHELPFESWIKCVPQPIAHQVEGEHGDQDRQSRKCHDPWRSLNEFERRREHRAPLRRRRLRAETEKTERSRIENRVRESERRLN